MLWWLLLAFAPVSTVTIPAGTFRMGDDATPDARPVRDVTVAAFRIDRTEVPVDAFEAFARGPGWTDDRCWSEGGRAWRAENPRGAGPVARLAGRPAQDHPVVAVTYWEAEAYCACAGGALPTEAQWERAACGVDPRPEPPALESGVAWYNEGKFGALHGVHTHGIHTASPPNVFGLLDMFGNVWEWTRDTYRADAYPRLATTDPVSTEPSPWRTVRGGSYMNLPSYAGCAHREPVRPEEPRLTVGFRCVYAP